MQQFMHIGSVTMQGPPLTGSVLTRCLAVWQIRDCMQCSGDAMLPDAAVLAISTVPLLDRCHSCSCDATEDGSALSIDDRRFDELLQNQSHSRDLHSRLDRGNSFDELHYTNIPAILQDVCY